MDTNSLSHAGVKGMKWKNHVATDPLSAERQTFNEIMMKQYKGPMTPEQQAKFVADRFAMEQKSGSLIKKLGGNFFQMSNEEIQGFIDEMPSMKEPVAKVSKKKTTAGKKKVDSLKTRKLKAG